MNTFRLRYDQFTPEERVHLVLAAAARGDADEVARLDAGSPRVKVVIDDPAYTELLNRMLYAGMGTLYHWLDVSHFVAQTRLAVALLKQLVLAETLMRAPGYTKQQLKMVVRRDRAALVSAEAECKKWSVRWKGIEAAITRFCAERRVTMQQLFAMVQGLPRTIEEAREDLDADVPADPQEEEAVYQALRACLGRLSAAEDSRSTRSRLPARRSEPKITKQFRRLEEWS